MTQPSESSDSAPLPGLWHVSLRCSFVVPISRSRFDDFCHNAIQALSSTLASTFGRSPALDVGPSGGLRLSISLSDSMRISVDVTPVETSCAVSKFDAVDADGLRLCHQICARLVSDVLASNRVTVIKDSTARYLAEYAVKGDIDYASLVFRLAIGDGELPIRLTGKVIASELSVDRQVQFGGLDFGLGISVQGNETKTLILRMTVPLSLSPGEANREQLLNMMLGTRAAVNDCIENVAGVELQQFLVPIVTSSDN